MNQDFTSLTDHDLLITLISEVRALRDDLKRSGDISADHETRIRGLEQTRWTVSGGAAVVGAALTLAVNYLLK